MPQGRGAHQARPSARLVGNRIYLRVSSSPAKPRGGRVESSLSGIGIARIETAVFETLLILN
jgi:hypothetical protein